MTESVGAATTTSGGVPSAGQYEVSQHLTTCRIARRIADLRRTRGALPAADSWGWSSISRSAGQISVVHAHTSPSVAIARSMIERTRTSSAALTAWTRAGTVASQVTSTSSSDSSAASAWWAASEAEMPCSMRWHITCSRATSTAVYRRWDPRVRAEGAMP